MLKRTSWEFDLRVLDELDGPEYQTLTSLLERLMPDLGVSGKQERHGVFTLTIQEVDVP